MKPVYHRILLKLSGEGLAGENKSGIDAAVVARLAQEIAQGRSLGTQICVVIGGGNFFRGAKNAAAFMDRSVADQIGMMATVMNALTLKAALDNINCPAVIYSGLNVPQVCEPYCFAKAIKSAERGDVVIFAGGTGNPYFTTDTGAILRAGEMHCEVLMKATQVDGVYDADPRNNPKAVRFENVSYGEVIEKRLAVMDMTAVAMAQEVKMPIMIFSQSEENAIVKAICGEVKHTIIE